MIRKLIPHNIKVRYRLIKNSISDLKNGYVFRFAKRKEFKNDFPHFISLKQDLKPNDAKKINLIQAINRIEAFHINPNEIFSFWKAVGNPSKKNGFVPSRSIVNGTIEDSVGGGLCQLSGLIYYVCLQADLGVLERYNHSIDIYNEETRFTPLGSDATVAYAYKDLKIKNNLKGPIRFSFHLEDEFITVKLLLSEPLGKVQLEFIEKKKDGDLIEVSTMINNEVKVKSSYKKPAK